MSKPPHYRPVGYTAITPWIITADTARLIDQLIFGTS